MEQATETAPTAVLDTPTTDQVNEDFIKAREQGYFFNFIQAEKYFWQQIYITIFQNLITKGSTPVEARGQSFEGANSALEDYRSYWTSEKNTPING